MFEKGLLAGKRILVTGGGSGLGAAMGRRFVELGAELIICGRRLELLEATAVQMRSDLGGKVAAIRCDIRDGAGVDAMLDSIWRDAPLDALVNNAAATFIAGIRTMAIAPGAFPTAGASGQLRPEGRDEGWALRNPLGRAGEHRELADLASFLISDSAGYINGEMVVQDGGAHLRSSGAEDLLQWTDAQWEKQRAARSKGGA
jgi:NAD(P)-dependent dehydrogenase (short-subunit alcohol dehydrogenase family)